MRLLSISVMAHPSREGWFPYLRERLGDPLFSVDDGGGIWENCKRAWMMHDPEAKYHVVIQDDAIVCEWFRERAEEFIRKFEAPGRVFNFYFGNKKNLREQAGEALKRGYAVRVRPGWGVAICLPTALIPEMIRTCDAMTMPQDDVRIGEFLHRSGLKIYYPMPCLIDHRVGQKSLVGDPGENRRAFAFIDAPC